MDGMETSSEKKPTGEEFGPLTEWPNGESINDGIGPLALDLKPVSPEWQSAMAPVLKLLEGR